MSSCRLSWCPLLLALLPGIGSSQPYGLSLRVTNQTLRLPASAPVPAHTVNAFPGLSFTNPVAITSPAGETNRLFVVEQAGVIVVITNLAAPTRTGFLDIRTRVVAGGESGLLGLAFHPGYATNRIFFAYYSTLTDTPAGSGLHQRLARFEVSLIDSNLALPESEVPLLTMRDDDSNHNGGDLHFGPDGCLYVSTGDEGGGNDSLNNSQLIDEDFWSGILRIDVDRRSGSLNPNPHRAIAAGVTNFGIPWNNPFVGVTNWQGRSLFPFRVRTEFYAIGFRNPWRMSFDPPTGRLYCGDVGAAQREEINVVIEGGNYGWAFREGTFSGPKPAPPGVEPIEPILDYTHAGGAYGGASVTGGVVYRGARFLQWLGRYVFADYVSGNVWSLLYDGARVSEFHRLAVSPRVSAFGVDPRNGDILLAAHDERMIKRLEPLASSSGGLPERLTDTGAFKNLATLAPHDGIVGYDVNLPSWSDYAETKRWFYIPVERMIGFLEAFDWSFPTGSVWIQHFDLELTNGVPGSKRRLETRFLVKEPYYVYGFTYRWDDTQTNATLVGEDGLDETFLIPGGPTVRTQIWHYPSRAECLKCHTAQGGNILGFDTTQLNRDFSYGSGVTDNQLRAMAHAGYFDPTTPLPPIHSLRALVPPTGERSSIEQRVRSYLAANCGSCHRTDGPAQGFFDARIWRNLSAMKLIDGPLIDSLGDPAQRVVVPGSIEHSMLHQRISIRGLCQMPPIGSTLVDTQAVALIGRWINSELAGYKTFAQWQLTHFGTTNLPSAAPNADPDGDRSVNELEYLTGTDPLDVAGTWRIGAERSGISVEIAYPRLANRGFAVEWTTNLLSQNSWQFLDVLENRPFFSLDNTLARVPDVISNGPPKFYRVRVYEP